MEISIIKYFAFTIGNVLVFGLLMLWLKNNKKKRKEEELRNEKLEIQKELYKQAMNKKINNKK